MTFTELREDIMDRLNLSSTDASTRIGRAINRTYRKVTTTIGLQLSRRGTISQDVTVAVSAVTFTNTEKVIDVWNRATTPYKRLTLVTIEELRNQMPYTSSDSPTCYAIRAHSSDTVTIEINCIPLTDFTLYADVHQVVADLSGSDEPAFPESFHDVIIEGVLVDEYRKLEKLQYAQMSMKEFDRILSDLRMWIAKGGPDLWQTKTAVDLRDTSSGGSGGGGGGGGSSTTVLMAVSVDPVAPADGECWLFLAGVSPTRVAALKINDGGVTRTIASITF